MNLFIILCFILISQILSIDYNVNSYMKFKPIGNITLSENTSDFIKELLKNHYLEIYNSEDELIEELKNIQTKYNLDIIIDYEQLRIVKQNEFINTFLVLIILCLIIIQYL